MLTEGQLVVQRQLECLWQVASSGHGKLRAVQAESDDNGDNRLREGDNKTDFSDAAEKQRARIIIIVPEN